MGSVIVAKRMVLGDLVRIALETRSGDWLSQVCLSIPGPQSMAR